MSSANTRAFGSRSSSMSRMTRLLLLERARERDLRVERLERRRRSPLRRRASRRRSADELCDVPVHRARTVPLMRNAYRLKLAMRCVQSLAAPRSVGAVDELAGGIRRVTLPLPQRPGHVHAYVLPGDDGWTLVDTGLGLPDARERWAAELDGLPGAVARIFVTHFHPDHVGAAGRRRRAHRRAGGCRGGSTTSSASLVWGGEDWSDVLVEWFRPSRRPRTT